MASELTSDGGETRVVPAGDVTLLNEPLELALGKEGVDEAKTSAKAGAWSAPAHLKATEQTHPKSHTSTLRSLSASSIHWYCGLRSRYSLVRSAWVTPSIESTIGQQKS